MNPEGLETYRHYKGGIYYVSIMNITNTETSERMVLYMNEEGQAFVRPYDMFMESVLTPNGTVKRFTKLEGD